ncbi:AAA family ATPase [Ketobacter alkanivorans]|uniref:AAA family ATPase n=1 Tax=Ketobacter alkanivorans TaxID=1917421 RepID=A0A2K9LQK6_9GAMM|nr:MoxR family ATPase [Ketobacter alkanivorans]AUM14537.1 AAA family ATPase [Ketobacter alkanivorans]
MTEPTQSITLNDAIQLVQRMREQIARVVVGQQQVIDQVLIAMLASGHVLVEGVPGLGKTLLVKALAKCFHGQFGRIQFTPDLMPSDVTGHALYDMKTEQFKIRKGPAFCNLLLADEINRAPAKTQSALLEVMQEKQITIEGKPFPALSPFMVLATQNPIEQEGTYPLPEAELDRFMLKVLIDYPNEDEEQNLVKQVTTGQVQDTLSVSAIEPVVNASDIPKLQQVTANIQVDDAVFDYAVRIARSSRQWHSFAHGAGPRASIALIRAARANALLQGNHFVTPDDVKVMALPVMRHRVALTAEMEIEGLQVDQALQQLLQEVEAPRL